jgi:hypothetical protein
MRTVLIAMMAAAIVPRAAAADDSTALSRLRHEIVTLIGPARCMNLVNCRVAALGVDACGGPAEYLTYSWLSTDKGALETKIAEYNFLYEDSQLKQRAAGTCAMPDEPVAACVNGRCVLPGK